VPTAEFDFGATEHLVAVPEGRDEVSVRALGTFTTDLEAVADWLAFCRVTTVAMESTGVYWIPLFELLDERGRLPLSPKNGREGAGKEIFAFGTKCPRLDKILQVCFTEKQQ
jgi:hypothetical protein